jgi:membrane protein DedA with SNARE-associated domain
MLHSISIWLAQFTVIFFAWVRDWGYVGVILLMAMESSIFPVPSEVVIPPAAYWAAQGKMDFWLVILAGTFGSWLGSAITYWVSRWVGRAVITRWGRYFFISESKLERAERWVHRYEAGGIFFARLLPVVRHLISIPAGIIGMNFKTFSAMTVLGAAVWCTVLAWFGTNVITKEMMESPASMVAELKHKSHWIAIGVLVLCVLYVVVLRLTGPKPEPAGAPKA